MTDLHDQTPLLRRYSNPFRVNFWRGFFIGFAWGAAWATLAIALIMKLNPR